MHLRAAVRLTLSRLAHTAGLDTINSWRVCQLTRTLSGQMTG